MYRRGIPRPLPLRAAEPHVFLVYLEVDGRGGCEGPPGGFRHGRVPDGPADRRFRYPSHRRAVLAGERIRHEGGLLDGDPLQLRRDLGPWGYPQQRVQRPYVSLPECVVIASPPVRHRADGGHYRSLRDLHRSEPLVVHHRMDGLIRPLDRERGLLGGALPCVVC